MARAAYNKPIQLSRTFSPFEEKEMSSDLMDLSIAASETLAVLEEAEEAEEACRSNRHLSTHFCAFARISVCLVVFFKLLMRRPSLVFYPAWASSPFSKTCLPLAVLLWLSISKESLKGHGWSLMSTEIVLLEKLPDTKDYWIPLVYFL